MTAGSNERPGYNEAASLDRVSFWTPLPGSSELSRSGRRLVQESDSNIRNDQLESALDACLALNAEEPDFAPGFIRTIELLLATQRRDHARQLLESARQRENVLERTDYDHELTRVQTHLTADVDLLTTFAQRLLSNGNRAQLTPFLPAAVSGLISADRVDESIELASSWVNVAPRSSLALASLVRAQLSARDGQAALSTIRRFRDEFDADRTWPENIVVSALTAIASPDMEPKWMAAGPVCAGLRNKALDYGHVTDLLEYLVPSFESPQRALLFAGLTAVNAGDLSDAEAIFQTTPAETPVESYLRNVGLERSVRPGDDQSARFAALKEIWRSLSDPQVAAIAESSEIFDPPATRETIGIAIAGILQENESYADALRFLDEVIQHVGSSAELVRLKAELMGKAGSSDDALAALEQLVQQQETQRKYADAVETLESMVKLVPGNVRLRQRIVENCLKIGKFNQAIDQLVLQGRLLHKVGKVSEAETPVHRAIEIATMTSEWDTVKKLHRLLISFDPDDTRLRHSAVTTYVQHGHTSEALDQLREIVRIARKHNDLDEGIAASHQMLALDPNDPATYHQLGELLVSIQEYNQADRVYRRLATLVPDDHAVKAKRSAIAALTRSRQHSSNH
jgi:tetratricopeptide (TPR) repeat protein